MQCKKCGSKIENEWRKDLFTIRHTPLLFCSRACSNSRIRTQEIKDTVSKKLKGRSRPDKRVPKIQKNCKVCEKVFESRGWEKRVTCYDRSCAKYLSSINRQKYLSIHGSFSTLREKFEYKDTLIEVDSNLEKAGIIYLIDILQAKDIQRFKNLINYHEKDSRRTFNPDFICRVDGQTCIVEIKQKWIKNTEHSYNRTIPHKKEALAHFCKKNKYKMLWLDFDSASEMKKIYKQVLKNRLLIPV